MLGTLVALGNSLPETGMDELGDLIDQAARARRLAGAILDPPSRHALLEFAADCEAKALDLMAQRPTGRGTEDGKIER